MNHVADVIALRPDIVLMEFATNDAAINRFMTLRQSAQNIREIVGRLRSALPDLRIYLQAMSPVTGLKCMIRPDLASYVAKHREVAAELHLGYIDHGPFWRQFSTAQLAEILPDGAHPQPELVADHIAATIAKSIGTDLGRQADRPGKRY